MNIYVLGMKYTTAMVAATLSNTLPVMVFLLTTFIYFIG